MEKLIIKEKDSEVYKIYRKEFIEASKRIDMKALPRKERRALIKKNREEKKNYKKGISMKYVILDGKPCWFLQP